jgi:hypothetical protein
MFLEFEGFGHMGLIVGLNTWLIKVINFLIASVIFKRRLTNLFKVNPA